MTKKQQYEAWRDEVKRQRRENFKEYKATINGVEIYSTDYNEYLTLILAEMQRQGAEQEKVELPDYMKVDLSWMEVKR